MAETWSYHPNDSLYQMEGHLNERILSRLKFLCTEKTADFRKAKRQAFESTLTLPPANGPFPDSTSVFAGSGGGTSGAGFSITREGVAKNRLDVYDAAAFGLIQRRIFQKQDQEVFSQIFIDEAQDFGETVYYVLKQVLNDCYLPSWATSPRISAMKPV